jgi:predicted transcriptional regulator
MAQNHRNTGNEKKETDKQFWVHVQIFQHFLRIVNLKCSFFRISCCAYPLWHHVETCMAMASDEHLTRKEREAMQVLYRLGTATAAQIQEQLSGGPSYSAVRALLTVLVEKGHALTSKPDGSRQYLYAPRHPVQKVRKGALKRLLSTFFDNSPAGLVANLLDPAERQLSPNEIEEMQCLIDAQRKQAKHPASPTTNAGE